jgi:hypothetical protein
MTIRTQEADESIRRLTEHQRSVDAAEGEVAADEALSARVGKTNDLDPYLRERNDLMFQMKEAITND